MGFLNQGARVGRSELRGVQNYEAAIKGEDQRIALNGLTKECIQRARQRSERLRFSSKGVDALGTAKRYISSLEAFGNNDKRTRQAEHVFDLDIMTGLFEETEDVHSFLVSYPVEDGRIVMGELEWQELAARGTLDNSTENWYQQRAFVEAREPIIASEMLLTGELREKDIITISNTSTAANAGEYFSGRDLMIRRVSLNEETGMVEMDQLKMNHISNEAIEKLFDILNIEVDEKTVAGSEDESAKYLATQIKVKKGELINGAADIGFLLDCILNESTGKLHLFGQEVDGVIGDPYGRLAEISRAKERKRCEAAEFLKAEFIRFAKAGSCTKTQLKEAYETARSIVADIEGEEFVRARYGESAASEFEKKQQAIEVGDMGAAIGAEQAMQSAMGDPSVCNTVMSGSKTAGSNSSAPESIFCPKLPKPGDIARCPCCRNRVVVAGTKDNIACSKAGCKLEDPKLKTKRNTGTTATKKLQKPKTEFKFFDFSHFKKAKEAREKSKEHETIAA